MGKKPTTATTFKDALDYIYIENNVGTNSYLISSDNRAMEGKTVMDAINKHDKYKHTKHVANNISKSSAATQPAPPVTLPPTHSASSSSMRKRNTRTATTIPRAMTKATMAPSLPPNSTSSSSVMAGTGAAPISTFSIAAAAAAAAATALLSGSGGGGNTGLGIGSSTAAETAAVTAAVATASTSGTALATIAAATDVIDYSNFNGSSSSSSNNEHLYAGVAVRLGAMLINDTLLMDVNGTSTDFFGIGEVNINGSDLIANETLNVTSTDDDFTELLKMAATSVVLGLMILITIIGNVFVIAAIILERNLQNVANYLVASLAVADLFVACLVMPLGAVYEISQGWILGPELCDIWTSCDVLCCTASILHLVAIAVDRYWAVTNIDYIHSRTSRRVFLMIFFVWTAAVIVSLAPQFGWKDPDYLQRIEQQKCMVSQDIAYQIFATCCTFYVPLLVILALYWKIYQTARKRIHRRRPKPIDVKGNNNQPDVSTQKKRKRLRLRLGKFATEKANNVTTGTGTGANVITSTAGNTTAALCIVEGNSTNTVNTVEDTEFSSSNVDNKSRAGIEVTTTTVSQISTVSHLVALANQQQAATTTTTTAAATKQQKNVNTIQEQQTTTAAVAETTITTTTSIDEKSDAALTATTTLTTSKTAAAATATSTAAIAGTTLESQTMALETSTLATKFDIAESAATANGGTAVEVLADPQLQQQLEQVQQQQLQQQQQQRTKGVVTAIPTGAGTSGAAVGGGGGGGGGGGATTSNATTITSISALSPQTPPTANPTALPTSNNNGITTAAATATAASAIPPTPTTLTANICSSSSGNLAHPLCSSTNVSAQVTPVPNIKNQQQQQQQKQQQQLSSIANPMQKVNKRKETLEAKRERKAAKTLAIITGAFVVCWLPFFVMALTLPLCATCQISDGVASLFLWLGYFNSTLNPVIYTIFSPEFRQAFKRILFGGHRPVHYRSGKL